MSPEEKSDKRKPVENFAEMLRAFGRAVSEVFDDPELKKKAKEFTDSATDAATTQPSRLRDEEVKAKFREVGRAAEEFGKGVLDHFKKEKKE